VASTADPPKDDRDPPAPAAPPERRGARRQRVDVLVTLHAGRLAVPGRAVNLSRQGVAVEVEDARLVEGAGDADPLAAVRALQRAFVGGLVVEFCVTEEFRIPARLARYGTGTSEAGTPVLGLRLARALADDEWARAAIAAPEPGPTKLRPVHRSSSLELALLDPTLGVVARVAVTAGGPTAIEGTFVGPRVEAPVLKERCGTDPRPARIDVGKEVVWIGSATLRQFHGGSSRMTARFDVAPPLPAAVLHRFEVAPRP
jgi:hypothetical protein